MHPSFRRWRPHAALYALIILLTCAAPVPAAEQSAYLPLAVGRTWTLHSEVWNIDIVFEVESYAEGAYRLNMSNPWMSWAYGVVPYGERVYMQSFTAGDATFDFGGYAALFDFDGSTGDVTDSPLGPVSVIATDKVVTSGTTTYENCLELRQVSANGFEQRWTFAPGVGFVEFRMAGGVFVIDETRSQPGGVAERFTLPAMPAQPRGDRVLSIDVNPAQDGDYLAALQTARTAGIREIGLLFEWNAIEGTPGEYDLHFLEIANAFFPSLDLGLNLTLAPVHNIRNALPSDLRDLPLDHPDVIARFQHLLDAVFAKLPDIDLRSLVVGSEVDGFLGGSPEQWQRYENFFSQVAGYARARRPGLTVTTEFHFFSGFLGSDRDRLESLLMHADAIGVTYYPLASDKVLDPAFVDLHFGMLRDAFPGKPIHFYQIGFPSSSKLDSSEALQARFVTEVFEAWDAYRDAVKLIDFTWLHDSGAQEVEAFRAQFGQQGDAFGEFIGSLGLRTHGGSGRDKAAMPRLREEAGARGW